MAFDWNQYQQADGGMGFTDPYLNDPSRTFDPSQASANTGINGGAVIGVPTQEMMNSLPSGYQWPSGLSAGQMGTTPTQTVNPPIPPAASGMTPSGQQWDQNYFTQNFGTPSTPQELEAMEAKITAAGGKVIRNAAGVAGKIQTPDGRVIDIINSAGAGGRGFQWLEGGGSGGGGMNSPLAGLGYNFGDSMSKFTAPTAEDALNSPGLQFALSEANRMGMNSGAARGVLGNGRFQQALSASNIQNALGGYQGVYDRNYQTFTRNQDAPFDKQYRLATLGKPT